MAYHRFPWGFLVPSTEFKVRDRGLVSPLYEVLVSGDVLGPQGSREQAPASK